MTWIMKSSNRCSVWASFTSYTRRNECVYFDVLSDVRDAHSRFWVETATSSHFLSDI